MASHSTRSAVAAYEREHNALLRAISPGGILYDVSVSGPYQVLLVPRQIALVKHSLAYYLQLGASADGGPLSPSREEFPNYPRPADVTSEQRARVREVLRRILTHHLLYFHQSGSSNFVTGRGHAGSFSDTLDAVHREGHVGTCEVLTDMDPLGTRAQDAVSTSAPGETTTAGGVAITPAGAPPSPASSPAPPREWPRGHPATLQLYLVSELLMDAAELQMLAADLAAAVPQRSPNHPTRQREEGLTQRPSPMQEEPREQQQQQQQQPPSEQMVGLAMNPAAAAPAAPRPRVRITGLSLSTNGEAEDIVVEEDLTPYLSKTARMRQSQGVSSGSGSAAEVPGAPSALSAPVATSAQGRPPPYAAAGSAAEPSAGARGLPVLAGRVAQPPQREHAALLNHEYSKESIQDYRRVVAADNDIGYREFELLMESPPCFPLVNLLSRFIEAAQMSSRSMKKNNSFIILMDKARQEIASIPSVAAKPRHVTILLEGIEKYATSKLYFKLFNVDERERRMNNLLQDKFQAAERLTAQQLDALESVESHHVWGQAMFELDGMNFFKSPREKLRCGMRACELLSLAVGDILAARQTAADQAGRTADREGPQPPRRPQIAFGADEFLPCFLLLVLRAQPYNFYQNVQFIDKFRYTVLRSPEESYCLANLLAAQEFWLSHTGEEIVDDSRAPPQPGGASGGARAADKTAAPSGKAAKDSRAGSTQAVQQGRLVSVPPPPNMQHEDLLPSIREASRVRYAAARESPPVPPPPQPQGAPAAGNALSIMDRLFDWAQQGGPGPRAAAESSAVESRTGSPPLADGLPPRAPSPSNWGGSGDRQRGAAPPETVTNAMPTLAPTSLIRRLLGSQNRAFDDLTASELRGIVEEARALAQQRP